MLTNSLRMAIKVLLRRKFFTAISLFGIAFTLSVLLVVTALIDHLLAPMAPEVNLARTLHVSNLIMEGGEEGDRWSIQGAPGFAFLERYAKDIPGVETTSICSQAQEVVSFVKGQKLVSMLRRTDGAYWQILCFDFLEGGPFTEADELNGNFVAVICEATRHRFFNDEPALGRFIDADGQRFQVVGVVRNVPAMRATATAEIWVPHSTAKSQAFRLWDVRGSFSALLLARSPQDFDKIKAEFESRLQHVDLQPPFEVARGTALTRLEEAALSSANREDGMPSVGRLVLMALGLAAAFLVLPTVNLVSINLSRISERSSEIGVRKAFGASSAHLVVQFVIENVVLCLVGGCLAMVAAAGILEAIEASGLIPYAELRLNHRILAYGLGLTTFFGVLSGVIPAWRTSRLHPVEALRGGQR